MSDEFNHVYNHSHDASRRRFLTTAGTGILAAGMGSEWRYSPLLAQNGGAQGANLPPPLPLQPITAPTERENEKAPTALVPDKRAGVAIVGLGRLSPWNRFCPRSGSRNGVSPSRLSVANAPKPSKWRSSTASKRRTFTITRPTTTCARTRMWIIFTSCCPTACTWGIHGSRRAGGQAHLVRKADGDEREGSAADGGRLQKG